MMQVVCIDKNKIKNGISEGCFTALASGAGLSIERVPTESDYGVDFHVKKLINIHGKISAGSVFLDVQLKGTTDYEVVDGYIKYNLRVKTYNDIVYRNKNGEIPILLIIMLLSKNESDWCEICDKNVIFKNSLFWYRLEDKNYLDSESDSTKLIKVPVSQVLTINKLSSLVQEYSYE
jgi:hypothetical protein